MSTRITKAHLQAQCAEAFLRGVESGKRQAVASMQEDLKAKKEDARLKLVTALGQCLQANATALESVARIGDEMLGRV